MLNILKENFKDLKVKYQPRDKLTLPRGTLNIDKAKSLLGYEPAVIR